MKKIKKINISKVYDLQNSSRTYFYKRILFKNAGKEIWSSSLSTLPKNKNKDEFDKLSVLMRFDHQLRSSGINTKHTLWPNFNWAGEDISEIINKYKLKKYILVFPF